MPRYGKIKKGNSTAIPQAQLDAFDVYIPFHISLCFGLIHSIPLYGMALTRSPDGFSSSARLDASEAIDLMEPLKFQTEDERHELSVLYEERLAEMSNAALVAMAMELGSFTAGELSDAVGTRRMRFLLE